MTGKVMKFTVRKIKLGSFKVGQKEEENRGLKKGRDKRRLEFFGFCF